MFEGPATSRHLRARVGLRTVRRDRLDSPTQCFNLLAHARYGFSVAPGRGTKFVDSRTDGVHAANRVV